MSNLALHKNIMYSLSYLNGATIDISSFILHHLNYMVYRVKILQITKKEKVCLKKESFISFCLSKNKKKSLNPKTKTKCNILHVKFFFYHLLYKCHYCCYSKDKSKKNKTKDSKVEGRHWRPSWENMNLLQQYLKLIFQDRYKFQIVS